jgi:hypothetical protein
MNALPLLVTHRKIPIIAETTKQQELSWRLIVSSSPSATREVRNDDANGKAVIVTGS